MLSKYPIYIPSKGRAKQLYTARMFDRDGVDYRVVVEPSQRQDYELAGYGDKLLILPEDGKGLVYSRNWITAHSRAAGDARHWQVDDDIMNLYRVYRGHRLHCESGPGFRASEDFADRYENVALLALNSVFFVPITKGCQRAKNIPPFYLNHRCYTCILFLNEAPYDWRPPNNEDADMTLQVLAGGWCTILVNEFLIHTKTTMTQKGGQTEAFRSGARLKMVRALERAWPGVVSVKRRFGHPQHYIKGDWKTVGTQLRLKPGVDLSKIPPNEYGMKVLAKKPIDKARLVGLLSEAPRALNPHADRVWPVYVISKGRWKEGMAPTLAWLATSGIKHAVVAEQEEAENYRATYPKAEILVLPESNRGAAFVREWVRERCVALKHPWAWVMDDDVKRWHKRENGRTRTTDDVVEALLHVQGLAGKGVGLVGPSRSATNFPGKGDVIEGKGIEWVIGHSLEACRAAKYRTQLKVGCEIDFALQVLTAGLTTRRTTLRDVDLPPDGSNAGGAYDAYVAMGGQKAGLGPLAELWPGILKLNRNPDGTFRLIRRWDKAKSIMKPASIVEG